MAKVQILFKCIQVYSKKIPNFKVGDFFIYFNSPLPGAGGVPLEYCFSHSASCIDS